MKSLYRFIEVFLLALLINCCKKDDVIDSNAIIFNSNLTYGTLKDINGFVYKTITIGTQTWMAENLKVVKYNDGIDIPVLAEWYEWCGSTTYNTPAICWYNSDMDKYMKTYGALYKWYAVSTGKLCPVGWHVPTTGEWEVLIDYIGGTNVDFKLKETGTNHWFENNKGVTNESGFTAIPSGSRSENGEFGGINTEACFWSATEGDVGTADCFTIGPFDGWVHILTSVYGKPSGLSVRCLKD